jgi:hypothetical protein
LGSCSFPVQAVRGKGKFSIHQLADNVLNTVEIRFCCGKCWCDFLAFKMQRSKSSSAKQARLSLNQRREIVMDSDSDEAQYNISGMEDEEMEPRPPS